MEEAREQRDLLCWSLYKRLITWLLMALNEAHKVPLGAPGPFAHSIAFLDVPGPAPSSSTALAVS